MSKIYFDNAASTPILPEVLETIYVSLQELQGNPSSIHSHGRQSRTKIEQARKKIANILKASIGEIFFTSCATEANNAIISQVVRSKKIENIISSKLEHPSVFNAIKKIEEEVQVNYVKNDRNGKIDLDHLEQLLSQNNNCLVSLMYVNNEIGNINPIEDISSLCQEYNALFHTDAVQAIGKIPIDLSKLNISFLSASAHKFYGPKGIGFFYMNSNNIIDPMIVGGAQERNMRAGTENIAFIEGMAQALEFTSGQMPQNQKKMGDIKSYFISELKNELLDIKINGDHVSSVDHILNVSFPTTPKVDMLMFNLDINGISVSSGSACSSGIPKDSQVMENIHHPSERKAIRFSFSHLNTKEEVDRTIEVLKTLTPCK